MLMPTPPAQRVRAPARGLSVVELMVGITVGMFVLAGATMVVTNQLTDNRRLLLETQIQQDLRAAMDIITRDVRRSGYWADAYKSVSPPVSPVSNPYTPAGVFATGADTLAYTYSHDYDRLTDENNTVDAHEQNGFTLNSTRQTIDVQLAAGNFQALTDPDVVRITRFDATFTTTPVNLPTCAAPPCAALSAACGGSSQLFIRSVTLTIEGEAVHDSNVKRSLTSTIRLRNDQVCL